ncbi:unnamed protein product [Durusdinium trenchii]|uniref:COX assembly mitochondrial protein n=2 Tax=Durusdinium trenchii TaxID=1381693 RepID=A0ABP0J5L3_9DINO
MADLEPEDGVVTGVPLEIFAEGLRARTDARRLVKAEASEERCEYTKMLCEGAFRSMRDCYLMDCREQTKRCNRLRDLMDETQIACEAAFAKCRKKPAPASMWQKIAELRGQW